MAFGKWLKEKRSDARVSGPDFERGGISRQYISNLETGHVERPSREYALKIARVLKINPNEALLAAGYAPEDGTRIPLAKPETLPDLLDALEQLGVQNVHFANQDALNHASPEELQEVLEAVQIAVQITLQRNNLSQGNGRNSRNRR